MEIFEAALKGIWVRYLKERPGKVMPKVLLESVELGIILRNAHGTNFSKYCEVKISKRCKDHTV